AMAAESGIVRTQAQTIRVATPHRTAVTRREAPTPTMAPVIVWVVLTGTPRTEAAITEIPPAVSAQKPPKGLSRVIRLPIVLTIRHPPAAVPSAMARWAESTSHIGM